MSEIIRKILRVAPEMHVNDLTENDLHEAIATGFTVIEEFAEGFAVIKKQGYLKIQPSPYLWFFYVNPEYRGQGIGRIILKDIRNRYATGYPLRLMCYGPQRATWFARCGFKIEARDGEWRTMIERWL